MLFWIVPFDVHLRYGGDHEFILCDSIRISSKPSFVAFVLVMPSFMSMAQFKQRHAAVKPEVLRKEPHGR